MNDYTIIGNYKISNFCYETYPCFHTVINISTGESTEMSGDEIYKLLKKEGLSDEHFDIYK